MQFTSSKGRHRLENAETAVVWWSEAGRPMGSIGPVGRSDRKWVTVELSADKLTIYLAGDRAAIRSAMLDAYLASALVTEATDTGSQ